MNRRELLKTAMAGAAAVNAGAQHEHSGGAAQLVNPPAAWKPLLFDAHQNETVTTLAELIIPRTDTPGAKDARVNEYIDLILADGPAEARNRFLEGLGWLDGYALRLHQQPFVKCGAEQQTAILRRLDGAQETEMKAGADFFRLAKRLTAEGYYTSEAGINELNKGGRVPASFGCQPGDH